MTASSDVQNPRIVAHDVDKFSLLDSAVVIMRIGESALKKSAVEISISTAPESPGAKVILKIMLALLSFVKVPHSILSF